MSVDKERLLNAEEAVHELLGQLKKLRTEIEGYSRAKTSLEEVRTQIGVLAGRHALLAENTEKVVAVLSKIGTPQILAQLTELQVASRAASEQMQNAMKGSEKAVLAAFTARQAEVVTAIADGRAVLERKVRLLTILVAAGVPLIVALLLVVTLILLLKG